MSSWSAFRGLRVPGERPEPTDVSVLRAVTSIVCSSEEDKKLLANMHSAKSPVQENTSDLNATMCYGCERAVLSCLPAL